MHTVRPLFSRGHFAAALPKNISLGTSGMISRTQISSRSQAPHKDRLKSYDDTWYVSISSTRVSKLVSLSTALLNSHLSNPFILCASLVPSQRTSPASTPSTLSSQTHKITEHHVFYQIHLPLHPRLHPTARNSECVQISETPS
jgi:hypothetical protein